MSKMKQFQSLQLLPKQLAVAILYFVLAQVVLFFFSDNGVVTMVYPPSGVALAILLIGGKHYFWGVLLGAFSSNAMLGLPLLTAAAIGSGNALSAFCGASLLTRNNQVVPTLNTLHDYLRLMLFGSVSCGVAALIGSSSLLIFNIISAEQYVANIRNWWMGDTLGVVLATPLILVLWQNRTIRVDLIKVAEAFLLIGLTFLTGQIVFLNWLQDSVGQVASGYWLFLFATWVATRLGTCGSTVVLTITAIQALVGSAYGVGFFANDIAKTNLANYWFYMVILSLVTMALAIYVGERTRAERELQKYRLHLEQLVAERTSQLNKAKEAAEAANIAKSTFIATMSHELRTPLNAVLGFSELMSRDDTITATQKDTLNIINRSGAHLLSMINDVLDISKIEAGRFELECQACDLIALLRDIDNMISVRATDKKLSFSLEIAPDITPYITIDNGKLRQVLINLLGNAIKFTQQGGIILRASTQSLPDETMVMLDIEVVDSGIGIPEDQQAELFKPFVQLAQANADVKGTGLGLAISKSLVELMGGRINVSSTLGVGSSFRITLPVPVANADIISIDENRSVKSLAPDEPLWRLLVVDDNFENRLLLISILTEVGFQVCEAENGQQAINLFEQWQPHLIWMDMRMPIMNGYEASAKIRQMQGGNAVKIIAITASAFKEQHDDIVNAGCDAVIHKPFRAPEIFTTLTRVLGVKFVYDDIVASPSMLKITPNMLSKLPLALRQQLHEAALNLDTEETDAVIARIRNIAPDIADALQELAAHYQFEQIIQLLWT